MNTTQETVGVTLLCVIGLLAGCSQKDPNEFVTTSNGLVYRANKNTGEVTLVGGKPEVAALVTSSNGLIYRINKQSGEVCLITGVKITKLDEPGTPKTDDGKKSYVKRWPSESMKQFADAQPGPLLALVATNDVPELRMKTTWRDGQLFYSAAVSMYPAKLKKERENSLSQAQFNVHFMDENGFNLFELPLKISQLTGVVDENGKISSLRASGSVVCSLEIYEGLQVMTVGWAGFPRD